MRHVLMLIAATGIGALCIGQGCPPVPAPGGNSHPPPDTLPPSTVDDGPDDPTDDLPRVHNLNGPWEDNGREVRITQTGDQVTALYVEPYVCDHRDGSRRIRRLRESWLTE